MDKFDPMAMQQLQDTATEIGAKLIEIWTPIAEAVVEIGRQITETFSEVWKHSPDWTFLLAYCWACGAHPKWVRILNRTKKRRIAKKYRDRILRAYLNQMEEVEDATH